MVIQVRRATFEEVAPFADAAKAERSFIKDSPRVEWFVALKELRIVACIGIMRIPFQKRVRVRGWYVLPQDRRLGIGRALEQYVAAKAAEEGFEWIEMRTQRWELLSKWGYTQTHAWEKYVLMERRLGDDA